MAGQEADGARRRVALTLAGVVAAAGFVALGRATAGPGVGHDEGYAAGRTAGYADGVQAGEQLGLAEGRALQEGAALTPGSQQPARDAFAAGYAAGATDVFAGYDGGWLLSTPYVVTLARGQGAVPYRIATRTPLAPDTTYRLCPDRASVCVVPPR